MYPWLSSTADKLLAQLRKGRLHHAIMLVSMPNIGVDVLSLHLAKGILCTGNESIPCGQCKSCLLFDASSHPDFHLPTTDKKQLGVDAIRQVMEKVNQTAQLGGNKVVVINGIESMTEAASNAFLKTLEEPTDNTFMLLSTEALDRLLPTIISRCEKHKLPVPGYQDCVDYFGTQNKPAPSEEVFISCGYSPLTALDMTSENRLTIDDFKQDLTSILSGQQQILTVSNRYKEQIADVLSWLYFDLTQKQNQLIQQGDQNSIEGIRHFIEGQYASAKKRIHQNGVNQSLLLNQVLLQFLQLQKTIQN